MSDEVIDEPIVDKATYPEGTVFYSHSKLSNQAQCPARNFFREIEDTIELDPAYPLVFGSAAHKGIEQRILTGDNAEKAAKEYLQAELFDKFPAAKLDMKTVQEKMEHMEWCLARFEENFYPYLLNTLGERAAESIEVKLQAPFRKGILTGVIDVLQAELGILSDWKTGAKSPREDRLERDRQQALYYFLARYHGIDPKVFTYVYLLGKNPKRVKAEYKSGEKKGQSYWKDDHTNPTTKWKYSYPVVYNEKAVERLFIEKINPLAKAFEDKIIYKEESDFNCNGCQYRTICPDFKLPNRDDFTLPKILPPKDTANGPVGITE